jgi:ankyrin repeat protein
MTYPNLISGIIRRIRRPTAQFMMLALISFSAVAEVAGSGWQVADAPSPNQQLLLAAKEGDTAAVRQLLKQGADIETKDHGGSTPLALAAEFGHGDTANLLLQQGADAVAGHMNGADALIEAAQMGNTKKVELLLERGEDLKAKNEALFAAAEFAIPVMQLSQEETAQLKARQTHEPKVEFPVLDHGQTA